jgi:ATP-dependent RNA helicase DOB1
LYLVVDENGKFHDNHFNKAVELLGETVNIIGLDPKKKGNLNQGADLSKIIKVIIERSMDPAIIFSFSKRDV